jgi:MoaA/NifB/PqqE/SkfB family radical SAM enzyme
MGKKKEIEKTPLGKIVRTLLHIPEVLPSLVQIEITNICNLDCPMCIRNFVDLPREHMDFDLFKQVIDQLDGVNSVNLTGYGEPLTHPDIIPCIKYCEERNLETLLTSNGLLLGKKGVDEALISSGLDSISFSLESVKNDSDVGHDNEQALSKIKNFINLRKSLGSPTPSITIQTLMIKGKEQDLFDVIEWSAESGADRVNVARFDLNTLESVERPNREEEKIIFKRFAQYRKKYSIDIACFQDVMFPGFKGVLYKYGKHLMGLDRDCIRTKDFLFINVHGHIRPCCALVDHHMGSVIERGLAPIWNSPEYGEFRANYKKIPWCSKCDVFCLKQADQ